jgi:hypothetical protein
MIEAFQTLDNGTLLDYALDERQYLTLRAGRSLTPAERPVVLELTPADAIHLMRIVRDLYGANPVDLVLQEALARHRAGATHDCGEWVKHGRCQLCQRDVPAR